MYAIEENMALCACEKQDVRDVSNEGVDNKEEQEYLFENIALKTIYRRNKH